MDIFGIGVVFARKNAKIVYKALDKLSEAGVGELLRSKLFHIWEFLQNSVPESPKDSSLRDD